MKLFVLTAIIAAVASSPLVEKQNWPWQVGKVYYYDVDSFTWSKFHEGVSNGNSLKSQFEISVKAPGRLLAKLINPQYASFKAQLTGNDIPSNLKYHPLKDFDFFVEIIVDGGRVISFNIPATISNNQENIVKGLISALQVDVSSFGQSNSYPNGFDKESFQGQFKKWEADVIGNCETLYSVSPVSAEWRREFPAFASDEDPFEIIKSKYYETCQNLVEKKRNYIDYTSESRFVVGKQGTIYKSQVVSSVFASPLLTGKQKAQVYSYVQFYLKSIEQDNDVEWSKPKEYRSVDSLLFKEDKTGALYTFGGEENVAKAQQLLQEITPLLQDPNSLPKGDFLVKFELLVQILHSLNSEQFNQLSSSIQIAKTSKNVAKRGMWIIYRDAVAQTGTPEAFEQIKFWILKKKIEGEEAAEEISAIGAAFTKPSKELLIDFFNFVKNPEVIDQTSVHTAALLAITKLLRYAEQDQFVVETVIPYLSNQLKFAVQDVKSSKAQIYIRALGNLGYPEILKVYTPYLDGTVAVSKYLRIQFISSLKTLANLKDPYVRTVLYSILKNTAEPYEVRVAAALNIFLTFPTNEMFQVMAHMTNDDPSTQVRAVLSNGIIFAAELKEPQFADLAQRAQAVLPTITKVKYGNLYSTDSLIDAYTGKNEFSFFKELSYIGSENHILPKYLRAALRFKDTGFADESQFTLSVSDMQDVISQIQSLFFIGSNNFDGKFKFSAKQLVELLNIKRAPRQPLEAALFFDILHQQKLVTFREEEFTKFLVDIIKDFEKNADSGFSKEYTKILTSKKETVLLPLASGMPFMLAYTEPVAIIIQAQANLSEGINLDMPKKSMQIIIDVTFTRNWQGSVGYFDTIGEVLTGAGVVSKLQLRIPTKITSEVIEPEEGCLKFEPVQTEKDTNVVHYSVSPYTGTQKKDSLTYDIELIKRSEETWRPNGELGYFRLKGYSYSSDFQRFNWYSEDLLTIIGKFLYPMDIALTEFNAKYVSNESNNKGLTLSIYANTLYNPNNGGELGRATLAYNKESVPRRKELVKKVSAGIKSAEVIILDVTAKVGAEEKPEYSFTSAFAYSLVDPKFQAGVFAHGRREEFGIVFQIDTQDTKIVPLNFEEALKNKINVTYDFEIVNQRNATFRVQGYGLRSEHYTQQLKNDPKGQICLHDVNNNNLYQLDCHKMIMKAHAPDMFKFKATTENPAFIPDFSNFFEMYKFFNGKPLEQYWRSVGIIDEDYAIIDIQAAYYDNYVLFQIISKQGLIVAKSEGWSYYPLAMAVYGPLEPNERIRNWSTGYQAWPFCTIDDNKVKTFSGRSYNYTLTSSWHVVMLDEADNYTIWNDLVILARRPSVNQEEVYISYRTYKGDYLEIEIKPNNVEIMTNGVKTVEGALTLYLNDGLDEPLLQHYDLGEGVQAFHIIDTDFRILYDKHRLVIFTDKHRSTTRGICGQSSGQIGDDYLTPWGLVDLPEHYGAAFTLEDDLSDPKTVSLKNESKLKAYQPVTKYTKIFYDPEWSKNLKK